MPIAFLLGVWRKNEGHHHDVPNIFVPVSDPNEIAWYNPDKRSFEKPTNQIVATKREEEMVADKPKETSLAI